MKSLKIKYFLSGVLFLLVNSAYSQNLLSKLDKEYANKPVYEIATFKTTRIGLGHSVEMRKKGALEISLFNRFWNHKDQEGDKQRFLADEVSTRFGLDYSFTDNLTVGIGYTNFDKITEGFLKYKILRQQKKNKKAPVSIVFFQGFSNHKNSTAVSTIYNTNTINSSINSFVSQLLIARKFNQKFSAQFTSSFISRNKRIFRNDHNNQFSISAGARYKVNGHLSLVSEYYHLVNPTKTISTYNPFMIGANWELSHLLLQFQITNARSFAEDAFITQTQNNFNLHDGNFHFGFNATFVLHTRKNKL
jgi:hypothetical protein